MIQKHFSKFKKEMKISGWDEGLDTISISREGFKTLLASHIEATTHDFDSSWYLKQYPDIAKSIASGAIESAKSHYIKYGYVEGRLPGFKNVNFEDYIERYPDISSRIGHIKGKKREAAALEHFVEYGYKEGRVV
ncbi:MAG: hypothetical protein ACSHX3_09110 [Litorimonas sp.]